MSCSNPLRFIGSPPLRLLCQQLRQHILRAGGVVLVFCPQRIGGVIHNVGHAHHIQHGLVVVVIAKGHHLCRVDAKGAAHALHPDALVGKGGIDPERPRHGAVGLLPAGHKALYIVFHALVQVHRHLGSTSVDEYECIYEYQVKNDKGSSDVTSTILQIGRNIAMFSDYTAFRADSAIACKAPETDIQKFKTQEMRNDMFFDQSVSQNVPKGKLSVYSVITPNYYSYAESGTPIVWNFDEDTDTICGYTCQKAVGEYGGRTWMVWYSTEIPVSFGPWKLCGLPGLVLAAKDSEGIHQFKAITFRKSSTPMNLKPYANAIKTSREQFIKSKNKFEQNPLVNIPAESISEMTIEKYEDGGHSALVNGVVLRMRPNGYVPLELK